MAVFQRYVVSHAQRDLWSLQKLVPESAAYNVVSAWRIRSRVDDGALAEALVEMANRHDALRTTYRERDGAVWAEVHDRVDGLRLVDARGTTDAELMLQISDEAHRPFDLEHGPVFRPKLFTISHDDHVLVLMAHQIVGDGWSLRIFMKELGLLYDAHAAGRSPALPPAGAAAKSSVGGKPRCWGDQKGSASGRSGVKSSQGSCRGWTSRSIAYASGFDATAAPRRPSRSMDSSRRRFGDWREETGRHRSSSCWLPSRPFSPGTRDRTISWWARSPTAAPSRASAELSAP